MNPEIVNNLNWIDVLVAIIFIRIIYMGVKQGVVIEGFKLVGAFFALFITLHYFSGASKFLQDKMRLPEAAADFFSYAVLWALVILVFKFIRDGFTLLIKMEATHSTVDKVGGLILSVGRGLFLCSLTVLLLNVSAIGYFSRNLEKSIFGSKLAQIAPQVYESTYDGFVSKFFPSEELNKAAFKLTDFSVKKETKKTK